VRKIQAERLCLGSTCLGEVELKLILDKLGVIPQDAPPPPGTVAVPSVITPSSLPTEPIDSSSKDEEQS